jgi:hypothetical protein
MPDLDFNSIPDPLDPGVQLQKYAGMGLNRGAKIAKSVYKTVAGDAEPIITPAIKGTYNAVEPLISKLFNQYLEKGNRFMSGAISNLLNGKGASDNLGQMVDTPNSVSWQDVTHSKAFNDMLERYTGQPINSPMNRVARIMQNDLGMLGDFKLDPLMHSGLGGVTKAGDIALKSGNEAGSFAKGLQNGERTLASYGGQSLLPSAVNKIAGHGLELAGKGITKAPLVGKPIKTLLEGISTKTGNVPYDNAKEQMLTSPNNASTIDAIKMEEDDNKAIIATAKKMNITPDELNKRILEYIEPSGSQTLKGQLENAPFMVQKAAATMLPPEMKALADKYIGNFEKFAGSEGGKTRDYYMEHNSTPEFQDLMKTLYPKIELSQRQAIEKAINDAKKSRGDTLGKYTINEINNMAQAGKLSKVRGLGNIPQLDEFKGKVFDDNVARVHAQRYLENAKVTNEKDFMTHVAKTYGVPKDALLEKYRSKEIKPGDLVEAPVSKELSKDGTLSFPPEIAKSLEKMKNMGSSSPWAREAQGLVSNFNNFTKKSFFGLFPASVGRIYAGNNALAYINDLWHPQSQASGLSLAKAVRDGKFTDKVIVNSPKLGPLTDRQVFNLAKENRAYGMGQFKMEVPKTVDQEETYLGSKGLQKHVVDNMWKAHNFAEDASRLGTFVETLRQGYEPFAGAKAVRKALYDYSDLGELDQKAKQLVPFYTFQRKNIENMTKQWLKAPGRSGLPIKLQNENSQDIQDQRKYWSGNKAEGTPIGIGNLLNKTIGTNLPENEYLHLNGLWPANDVNRYTGTGRTVSDVLNPINIGKSTLKTLGGMVNAFVRTPVEMAANYNLNAGQKIEKIPGQMANFGNVVMPKLAMQYPLSQLRALNDPMQAMTDDKTGPIEKLLRYSGGLSLHEADPQLEKNYSTMEDLLNFKGTHELGVKNMPRYFAKEAQRKYQSGDKAGAKAAYMNELLSVKQEKAEGEKLKQLLSGGQ